jgi:DNA-binding LytR/AlgR family response regulator
MEMKLVIVDSDQELRERLWALLSLQRCFKLTAELNTTDEAVEYMQTNEADVIFINNRPADASATSEGSYLSYVLSNSHPDTQVVVYGTYREDAYYAVRGLSAGFLLLPFDPLDLQQTVNRLRYVFELQTAKKETANSSLMIKTKTGYQLVRLENVLFLERVSRTCRIVTADGGEIGLQGYSMADLERILEPRGFYRCHQSFLVNLAKVETIQADNDVKHFAISFRGFTGEIAVSREKYMDMVSLLRNKFARLEN